jgi:hypothetical protein
MGGITGRKQGKGGQYKDEQLSQLWQHKGHFKYMACYNLLHVIYSNP